MPLKLKDNKVVYEIGGSLSYRTEIEDTNNGLMIKTYATITSGNGEIKELVVYRKELTIKDLIGGR